MTVDSARKTARQQQSATAVRGARLNTTILKPLACRSFTTLYTFLLKGFQSSAFIANLALDFLATSVSSCRVEGLRHKQNAVRYTASAPWAYIFFTAQTGTRQCKSCSGTSQCAQSRRPQSSPRAQMCRQRHLHYAPCACEERHPSYDAPATACS